KGVGAGYGGSAGNVTITIVGDVGDDILIGTPETDTFAYTGGNDVITNYGSEDTVHIKSGKIDGYSFEGSDLIFHIGNGSLRLNNMTNHAITVKDSAGKTTTQVYGTGYSGHEVMKRFVHSMANSKLDTKAKLDEAIKACSHFNSLQEVIDKLISDLENSDDAERFLQKYCGIFYGNADNGAVIGWDVGGLRVKTEDDILPTDYSNSYPTLTTFTKRGLTLTVPAKNTLTEEEQRVVQKIYSADMEDAIKLIEETYEFKFTDKPLTLPLYLVHQPGNAPAWAGVSGITANLSNGGDNPAYYLSHELTHVAQQHFGFFDHMPNFMFEGMADLTAGGDVRGALALVGNPSRLAQYLNLNNNSDVDPYTSGVIFWRYLMRQASDSYDSSKNYSWKDNSHISGTANGELLTGSGTNVTIVAGAGNDTLTVYGKNMKAFGEEGADCILIGSLASGASIDGGLGNDSIDNSGSNVTINGGAGNDTIENYGNKVTLDGGTGSDSINSKGDSVKIFGGADNDIILVEKTSDYNWDIEAWVDTYHDKATIDGGLGNDSIKNENSNASINGGAGNDSINTYGSNVTINGGAGNDSINTYGSNVTI
ncbi:MAG: calcium-binding protein, partial [Selenomonadaceae bacterium]|nr:calcium-binding protein [Selenomonadaceae bacterium]